MADASGEAATRNALDAFADLDGHSRNDSGTQPSASATPRATNQSILNVAPSGTGTAGVNMNMAESSCAPDSAGRTE